MSAQRFTLAIGIGIVVTLASLLGVLVTVNHPAAGAANAAAATPSPSPGGHSPGPHDGIADGFGRGGGTGTVTGISNGTITLRTLRGTLTVMTTSSTTYSKEGKSISLGDIKVDDVLQVRPVHSSSSTPSPSPPTTITAQAITVVMPTFFGRVTSVSGPTIFIVTHNGQEAFVYTTSSTAYTSKNASASLSDVKAGDYVVAEGTQTDLKHLTADHVTISTSPGPAVGPRSGGPFRPHGPGAPQPSGTAT
jgi:hypothetical protein